MIKIMFICHGNICRSPMAEFVFKDMVHERGLDDCFVINSCATSTEEIGNPIYPPAQAELRRQGVPFGGHRAVQLTRADYDKYDYLIGMDDMNVRNIGRIVGYDGKKKVHKLLDFTHRGGSVADPWYTDRFDTAFRDIREGCEGLLEYILAHDMQ